MKNIAILLFCLFGLVACAPPINQENVEFVQKGETPEQVMSHVRRKPYKIVKATHGKQSYLAYYYPMQTGTSTQVSCDDIFCTPYDIPISSPYVFIFKDASNPRLYRYGLVEQLNKSPDPATRTAMQKVANYGIKVQPNKAKKG